MAASSGPLDDSQAPKLYAIFSVFLALPLVAVGLRLVARRMSKLRLWWDDLLILIATIIVIVNFAFLDQSLKYGGGRHVQTLKDPNDLENFLIFTFADEVVYALLISLVQLSILCLYLRIFGIDKSFARLIYIFIAMVIAWGIATLLTCTFQCSPIAAAWSSNITQSHCLHPRRWLIGTNAPHILIDFSILSLPMPQIWRLNLSTGRKICLSGVFLMGAFASAVSIIRVHASTSITRNDPTWNYVAVMIWSTLEGNMGVVCACLPTLGILIQPLLHPRYGSSSSAYALPHRRTTREPHDDLEFTRLDEDTSELFPPRRAVLVERRILVERSDASESIGLDTFCIGGKNGART